MGRRYPYQPGQSAEASQFLIDELRKIAEAISIELNVLVVHHNGTVDVGTVEDTDIIGIGTTPDLEAPAGVWNSATGEWTAPETAYYQWDTWINIDGTAGGQEATYTLRAYKGGVLFETPPSIQQSSNRNAQLILSDYHLLEKGDVLKFEIAAIKASGATNTADYYAHTIIKREAIA